MSTLIIKMQLSQPLAEARFIATGIWRPYISFSYDLRRDFDIEERRLLLETLKKQGMPISDEITLTLNIKADYRDDRDFSKGLLMETMRHGFAICDDSIGNWIVENGSEQLKLMADGGYDYYQKFLTEWVEQEYYGFEIRKRSGVRLLPCENPSVGLLQLSASIPESKVMNVVMGKNTHQAIVLGNVPGNSDDFVVFSYRCIDL